MPPAVSPAAATIAPLRDRAPVAGLLVLGGILAAAAHALHPKVALTPENILAHPEWAAVHLLAGLGYALVAAGALAIGPQTAIGFGRALYATLAVGAFAVVVAAGLDGSVNPGLARAVLAGREPAVLAALQGVERHLYVIGFSFVGIAGTLIAGFTASVEQGVWRALGALGSLGFVALLLAGVLVIGAGLPLAPLFFGGFLGNGWLALNGIRTIAVGPPLQRAQAARPPAAAGHA